MCIMYCNMMHYILTLSRLLSVAVMCVQHVLCVSVLKKVKHRLVENMSSGTADALGLSRAILCNGQIIAVIIVGVTACLFI